MDCKNDASKFNWEKTLLALGQEPAASERTVNGGCTICVLWIGAVIEETFSSHVSYGIWSEASTTANNLEQVVYLHCSGSSSRINGGASAECVDT